MSCSSTWPEHLKVPGLELLKPSRPLDKMPIMVLSLTEDPTAALGIQVCSAPGDRDRWHVRARTPMVPCSREGSVP